MPTSINKTLVIEDKLIDLSTPKVMGILNVTPDSFYDGRRFSDLASAVKQAEKMLQEGADFIDVGGYSSRPGAADVSQEEELARVLPVVREIKKEFPTTAVSIDTFRSEVAQRALDAGAGMVNDISAGDLDAKMIEVVASAQVPYVAMHLRGTPQTMNTHAQYENLLKEILEDLQKKIFLLTQRGLKDIVVDPGFGFAKNADQNFELLRELDQFLILNKPLLVGLSRKSMIWKTLAVTPEEALNGTTALNAIALIRGASILRVHDVAEAKQCITLVERLRMSG